MTLGGQFTNEYGTASGYALLAHSWLKPEGATGSRLEAPTNLPNISATQEPSFGSPYLTTSSATPIHQSERMKPSVDESLKPALERLAEMARLEPNWDAEGARPLAAQAIAQACLLIEIVSEAQQRRFGRRIAPWTSAPIADGGLQVEWLGRDAHIEVQIAPDGSLGYLIQRGSGATAEYEEEGDAALCLVFEKIDRLINK